MFNLALKNLLQERGRFILGIIGVAFANLLIMFQMAMVRGTFSQVTNYIEKTDADIWVLQEGLSELTSSTSFVSSSNIYEDAGSSDPADTAGDLVYTWTGGRSAGTNQSIVQATAGSRPELSSDGTHGLVVCGVAAATKFLNGVSWAANSTANGHTFGMRVRRSARAGGTPSRGFAIGQDFASFDDGIGEIDDGATYHWRLGSTPSASISSVDESTDWLTVLGSIDTSKNAELYINDSSSAVATGTLSFHLNAFRHYFGHPSNDMADFYVYKWFSIDEVVSDVAGCMSWLEE